MVEVKRKLDTAEERIAKLETECPFKKKTTTTTTQNTVQRHEHMVEKLKDKE